MNVWIYSRRERSLKWMSEYICLKKIHEYLGKWIYSSMSVCQKYSSINILIYSNIRIFATHWGGCTQNVKNVWAHHNSCNTYTRRSKLKGMVLNPKLGSKIFTFRAFQFISCNVCLYPGHSPGPRIALTWDFWSKGVMLKLQETHFFERLRRFLGFKINFLIFFL